MSPQRHKEHKELRDIIAGWQPEMVEFTRRLIAIPTENPPGDHYEDCLGLLEDLLRQCGLEPRREGLCLLASYGTGLRTVYFSGHYDVVPHAAEGQFQPEVRGQNLFGRGSSDMKSGLVSMIYAARALRECGLQLDGRVGLVLVPDEETSGPRGSRYLEAAGLLGQHGVAMFTPEPTSGVVWNASRGAISLRVTVRGKSAHVGLQHQGVNAFESMLNVARRLQRLKAEVETRHTAYRIEPAAARHSILMLGGQCESGPSFNTVPGTCSFTVDRRVNPEEDQAAEKRRLLEELRGNEVETLQEGQSGGSDPNSPPGRALAAAIEQVLGRPAEFSLCPGLLETRFYAARGIPAFAYGPGLLTVSHGPEELVPLRNIGDCAAIYALTAARLLNPL